MNEKKINYGLSQGHTRKTIVSDDHGPAVNLEKKVIRIDS